MNSSQNPFGEEPDHPSQSIPNAAYPDAPYQPGSGFHGNGSTTASTGREGLASSVAGHDTSTTYSNSYSTSPNSSSPNTSAPSGHQTTSPSVAIPDVPPPPYVRHEQPSPYIPTRTQTISRWTGAGAGNGQQNGQPESVPMQNLSLATSAQGSLAPSVPITQQEQLPSPYTTGSGSISVSTQAGKPGPLAEARRRRRRRVKICIVILIAVCLFILALIIGIALGVLKSSARNN